MRLLQELVGIGDIVHALAEFHQLIVEPGIVEGFLRTVHSRHYASHQRLKLRQFLEGLLPYLFPVGIYGEALIRRRIPTPRGDYDATVAAIAEKVRIRVLRWFARSGLVEADDVREMLDTIGASSIDELFDEEGFDAVFLGVGAGLPRFLDIPGEQLVGVYSANEYLTRAKNRCTMVWGRFNQGETAAPAYLFHAPESAGEADLVGTVSLKVNEKDAAAFNADVEDLADEIEALLERRQLEESLRAQLRLDL